MSTEDLNAVLRARRAKLDELAATAADPKRHKQFLMRASLIDSVRKAATID